jgi:hypothetical protein
MEKVEKRKVGRPVQHVTSEQRKAANAFAARQYRARQRAQRQERRDLSKQPRSSIIDLSALLPPWHAKRLSRSEGELK